MATVNSGGKTAPSADDIEVRVAGVARRALRRGCSNAEIRLSAESYVRCMRIAYGALPTIDIERAISKGCRAPRGAAPIAKRQQPLALPLAS